MNEIPIHAAGRLVTEPQRTYRRDGVAVTRIEIEVTQRRLTPNGWRNTGPTRLECRAWAGLAEHIYHSLGTGDRVLIIGRLRQRPISPGTWAYDVILEDLGASLAFNNVWPVAADESSEAGTVNCVTPNCTTSTVDDSAGASASIAEASR
jgi:hypothetical protein